MCPTEPKAVKLREWVCICDDNGERNFSVFLHLGEIFFACYDCRFEGRT